MGKIKEFLFPANAGLEIIDKSGLPPYMKLELLRVWNDPYKSRADLKWLKTIVHWAQLGTLASLEQKATHKNK